VQSEKTELPIVLTDEGIVTEVKPLHWRNAEFPIEVTDEGIVTEVNLAQ
jgi:hypothetical protein